MLIIIDKNTGKVKANHGTNSMFPDGNVPSVEVADDEMKIMLHDDSEEVRQILNAHDYSFPEGVLVVHKTHQEHLDEVRLTPEYKKQAIESELKQLDIQFLDARLIEDLIEKTPIKKDKLDIIARKKVLRQQLKELGV